MDTPVFNCMKTLCNEFNRFANKDTGVATGPEVDNFVKENFRGWLQCPSNQEKADEMKAKVEALKCKGIDKNAYAELICLLLKAWCNGEIGVKECKPSGSA